MLADVADWQLYVVGDLSFMPAKRIVDRHRPGYKCPKRQQRTIVSIYVDHDLASAVREVAARERVTLQDLGERLLNQYVLASGITNPDLHLVVDGTVVRPQSIDGHLYRFIVSAESDAVFLVSRTAVPAEFSGSNDRRRLGVPVARIVLRDASTHLTIEHGDSVLREGFHEDEGRHRWTDGRARVPQELLHRFSGEIMIEVHLIEPGLKYDLAPAARRRPPDVALVRRLTPGN